MNLSNKDGNKYNFLWNLSDLYMCKVSYKKHWAAISNFPKPFFVRVKEKGFMDSKILWDIFSILVDVGFPMNYNTEIVRDVIVLFLPKEGKNLTEGEAFTIIANEYKSSKAAIESLIRRLIKSVVDDNFGKFKEGFYRIFKTFPEKYKGPYNFIKAMSTAYKMRFISQNMFYAEIRDKLNDQLISKL